jgi:hypothetical protein
MIRMECKACPCRNGNALCGKTMVTWAHDPGVQSRLIEPRKPSQNAYIESFNAPCATNASTNTGLAYSTHAPRSNVAGIQRKTE